jgi:hypothetical protein
MNFSTVLEEGGIDPSGMDWTGANEARGISNFGGDASLDASVGLEQPGKAVRETNEIPTNSARVEVPIDTWTLVLGSYDAPKFNLTSGDPSSFVPALGLGGYQTHVLAIGAEASPPWKSAPIPAERDEVPPVGARVRPGSVPMAFMFLWRL